MPDHIDLENLTDRELLISLIMEQRFLTDNVGTLADRVDKQNNRISVLETWRSRILGGAAVAAIGSPLFLYEVRQAIASALGG